MRIDSPLMTNAIVTGSFSGSFTGAFDGDITADSVAYANVTGKPTLVSGSAQVVALVEAGTDSNTFTDADHTKLNGIEASADVTDTANVTAAGALMDSEVTNLAEVKAFDSSDYATAAQGALADSAQQPPSEGAFANGDKTKLDGIEASADVTDTANVTAAGALMDSELTDLVGVKGVTISTLQVKPSEGAFADGDKTKLDGIEASADVTDTANVTSAGALMDSECASLADVKALDQSVISGASPTFSTANFTDASNKRLMTDAQETKLDSVESNADVTDTANVTAAGALMDSELTNLAAVKAINQGLATSNNVQFNDLTVAGDLTVTGTTTSINSTDLNVTDKLISINRGGADAASANGAGLFISGANESLTWDNGNSRFSFSDDLHAAGNITLTGNVDGRDVASDGTKLDGIEASADVTDTANVTAAGALMDSEVTNLAQVKAFDSSDYATAAQGALADSAQQPPSEGAFANGDKTKLDGIETGATADQTKADINGLAITEVGTIDTGVWNGTAINQTYLVGQSGTNTGDEPDASATVKGIVELATTAETTTGTDATRAVTPDGLKDGYQGSSNVTTLGTISTGTWQGTAIADAYLSSNTAHLSGTQTFSGAKTFSAALTVTNSTASTSKTTGAVKVTGGIGLQGDLFAGGDVVAYASSDERLKDNVEEISNALDRVEKLRGVSFDWNDKQSVYSGHDIGVIAQDVEEVLPELVENRDNGYKAVKYDKLTAVLIQAVKELSAKVKELENK